MTTDSPIATAKELAQLDALTNDPRTLTITDLEGTAHALVAQTFNTFKTKRAMQLLAGVRDKVDVVQLVAEIVTILQPSADDTAKAQQTLAAFSAVPKLMEFAPDLLLDFAALAIVPNREIARAYRDNTLDALLKEKREWLEFEFDAGVPLKLLVSYLPHVGIDFLARELGALNQTVENLTSQADNQNTIG